MEIKKGDTVRVSEDAPRMYLRSMKTDFLGKDCEVYDTDGDNAAITSGPHYIAIPTKYLIKVDAEAEEESEMDEEMPLHESFQRCMADCIAASKKSSECIKSIEDCMNGGFYTQSDFLKDYDPMEHRINFNERLRQQQLAHSTTVAEFSNKDFDWQRYQADLAREIALKVANRYNNSEETAEYAAKAAKQIIKHLKEHK